jgi:hypothetical protein
MLHISIVLDESLAGGYHCQFRAVDYPAPGEAPDSLLVTSSWEETPAGQLDRDQVDEAIDTAVAFLYQTRRRPF